MRTKDELFARGRSLEVDDYGGFHHLRDAAELVELDESQSILSGDERPAHSEETRVVTNIVHSDARASHDVLLGSGKLSLLPLS